MIHPAAQRSVAKKIGAKTIVLHTGHVPMLSNLKAVADDIANTIEAIR
jgi:hypothetical protein